MESNQGLDDYLKDESDFELENDRFQRKPVQESGKKTPSQSKSPVKQTKPSPKPVSSHDDSEEDFIDYDEKSSDGNDEQEQIVADIPKPKEDSISKPNNPFANTKPASHLPTFSENKKNSNRMLNQFHTVKSDPDPEESEEVLEEDSEVEDESGNQAMIEALIRMYNADPESLGPFEKELVERELAKKSPEKASTSDKKEEKEPILKNQATAKFAKEETKSPSIIEVPKPQVIVHKSSVESEEDNIAQPISVPKQPASKIIEKPK